jgi:hypothetical protein
MMRFVLMCLLVCGLCGCVNLYRHVDPAPDGGERQFRGIADYLRDGQALHVFQVHGMGDHGSEDDCGEKSENLVLQGKIAFRLHYVADPAYTQEAQPIAIDATAKAGTYSISRFVDPSGKGGDLYFSCVTWGETGRVVKTGMLALDNAFLEQNQNEAHRAWINSWAKRFVNRSFSDPVLYLGPMGGYIRRVVWKGIALSLQDHARLAPAAKDAAASTVAQRVGGFLGRAPIVIISDSLGSRIVFDALCTEGAASCGNDPRFRDAMPTPPEHVEALDALLAQRLEASVGSVYMLANQLPLLELGNLEPPSPETSLEDFIKHTTTCYGPFPPAWSDRSKAVGRRWDSVQVIAFTDPNDALSYHLDDRFKRRCGHAGGDAAGGDPGSPPLDIVNVTLPNAKPRWLFVYSDLAKAHSSGFKENDRAIDYLVRGNHPAGRQ